MILQSHFSDTDFSIIYLIHWKLFCYFNLFKGNLAWNRLKSLIVTTSKVLRNFLDFNTPVDHSAFFNEYFFNDS